MKLLLLLLSSIALLAQQPTLTATAPASVVAGAALPVTVTLSSSGTSNLAAAQNNFTIPSGYTISLPTTTVAGAEAVCNNNLCAFVQFNPTTNVASNNPLVDGPLYSVQLQVPKTAAPGTVSVPLVGLIGASSVGFNVAMTAGTPLSFKVLSRCDINGDGVLTAADAQAMVQEVLNAAQCGANTCTVVNIIQVIVAVLGGTCQL